MNRLKVAWAGASALARAGLISLACLALAGLATSALWPRIAVASAPSKKVAASRDPATNVADDLFWQTFHGGHYDAIQPAIEAMTEVYVRTPRDAVTAARIGWLHTWRVAERARNPSAPATITDDVVLAKKYFREASMLVPSDARYLGFLATQVLAEAHIDQDERETREGYFMLLDAVKAWPEFNLFTAGYVVSDAPVESAQFKAGLEQQWRNLDVCVDEPFSRTAPDYARYMALDTKVGPKRACWNSWIAPHNIEGFFLNMGDMLVRSGDWRTAVAIYGNAKASREYSSWKFQGVLEQRIAHAKENVGRFNHPESVAEAVIMLDSTFACMACHQD
ncbi:MAG: hypothetical protein ACLQVI_09035 [Polyangiaceae bacterium]